MDEMRKQVEKECALSREEAAKELNNVKTEVESTRCGLELRQRQVEAVITEVLFMLQFFWAEYIVI